MNLKEVAQKIEEGYPAAEVFSSMIETAALLQDNVYDIYGLAELCSEDELAEVFDRFFQLFFCFIFKTFQDNVEGFQTNNIND